MDRLRRNEAPEIEERYEAIVTGLDRGTDQVILAFERPVLWVALLPEDAEMLAERLLHLARLSRQEQEQRRRAENN